MPDAVAVLSSLNRDGAPIDADGNLLALPASATLALERFDRLSEPLVLQKHLDRIASSLREDPAAAIASSKELAESTFKFVLDDYAVDHQPTESMLDLYKKTAAVLKIDREAVPDSAKGSKAAQRVLQNLATAVQSLAELRNELGLGHGQDTAESGLGTPRAAGLQCEPNRCRVRATDLARAQASRQRKMIDRTALHAGGCVGTSRRTVRRVGASQRRGVSMPSAPRDPLPFLDMKRADVQRCLRGRWRGLGLRRRPELPEVQTQGKNLEDARTMVKGGDRPRARRRRERGVPIPQTGWALVESVEIAA